MRKYIAPILLYVTTCAFCVVAVIASSASCTSNATDCKDPKNASSVSCQVESDLIDCAGTDLAGVIATFGPKVVAIIESSRTADGSIDWSAIASRLEQAALQYGTCVVSEVFASYVFAPATPPPVVADAGVTPVPADGPPYVIIAEPGSPQNPTGDAGPNLSAHRAAKKSNPAAAKAAFDRLRGKLVPRRIVKTSRGAL